MTTKTLPALLISCLVLAGCSSETANDNPTVKKTSEGVSITVTGSSNVDGKTLEKAIRQVDENIDWVKLLDGWKSKDPAARVAIINKNHSLPKLNALEKLFLGKSAEDLKQTFGEPTSVEKRAFNKPGKTHVFPVSADNKIALKWHLGENGKVEDMTIKF